MTDAIPAQCALDRAKLDELVTKVDKISLQVDTLVRIGGPLAQAELRLAAVEDRSTRAHQRIDELEDLFDELRESHVALVIKVGLVMTPVAAAVGALVSHLF